MARKAKKRARKANRVPPIPTPKSMRVEKAQNGFVVSYWDGNKDNTYIAKSVNELKRYLNQVFGK